VNLIQHRPDLAQVVMPLVRVMALADLSWADRAKFAEAVQRCCSHWQSMQDEANFLNQANAASQQSSAGEKP
jgi:hypothetical protein